MARIRHILIFGFVAVLLGGGGLAWLGYAHFTDPETVRQLILEKARAALPGGIVQLARVQGHPLGDCKLIDFSIQAHRDPNGVEEICRLAQVTVTPDHRSLSEGKLLIRKLVLEKPQLRLRRNADGSWNVSQWRSDKPIVLSIETEIEIHDGSLTIEFADPSLPFVELAGIDATIKVGPPAKLRWKLKFTHELGKLQSTGEADLAAKTATATMTTSGACNIERLREILPATMLASMKEVPHLAANFATQGSISIDWTTSPAAWNGSLSGSLNDIQLEHPALPFPIEKGSLTFDADRAGLEIPQLAFLFGHAFADANARLPNWNKDQLEVAGRLTGLQFNQPLYEKLPPKLRQNWDKFSPRGSCDLLGSLRVVEGKPRVVGTAQLNDCSIAFRKFPYPCEKVRGAVELLPDGSIAINCQGSAGDATGTCRGVAADTPAGPTSDVEIVCKNALIDDKLDAALQPQHRVIYRKFKGEGRGDVSARFVRKIGDVEPNFNIEVDCRLNRVQCEWFPYELEDASGHISIFPHKLVYRDFVGRSDRGTVRVDGQSVKTTQGLHVETLIRGENIALDDKLLCALPVGWDRAWNVLRPEGSATVTCTAIKPPDGPLDLQLKINPSRAAITPTVFPYRLENFVGDIEYSDRRVRWSELQMAHRESRWTASGEMVATGDGGQLTLWNLKTRWLPLGGDFRSACPAKVQNVIDFLAPNKPIAMLVHQFQTRWFEDRKRSPVFAFDGQVGFKDTDLVPAVGLKNATGGANIVGNATVDRVNIEGNIDLKQLTISRFTSQDLSGRLAVASDNVKVTDIKGRFYGGDVFGQVLADIGQRSEWKVKMTAVNARLGQYLQQTLRNPPALDGMVDVDVSLKGDSRNPDYIGGSGQLHIRDADVVRLPVVQDLFKIINLRIPDGKAFDDILGYMTIRNKLLIIDDLALTPSAMIGPSLSLKSESGRIELDSLRLELMLVSRYGKGKLHIPIVSDTLNLANDQIMKIRIHGTLMDPITTLEPMEPLRRMLANPFNARRRDRD